MMTLTTQESIFALLESEAGEKSAEVTAEQQEIAQEQEQIDACVQQELVSKALQGDSEAFTHIISSYTSSMFRTALTILRDHDMAEDIVQDALILAWHHLPTLRNAPALRSWLLRIVINQSISLKRRITRTNTFLRQALTEQELDLVAHAADLHKGQLERTWDLAQAVESLPIKQKIVIIL